MELEDIGFHFHPSTWRNPELDNWFRAESERLQNGLEESRQMRQELEDLLNRMQPCIDVETVPFPALPAPTLRIQDSTAQP